jgi:GntR family transcriptional regulator/MocR family aminotransferase
MDLHLDLSLAGPGGLRGGIEEALRDAILTGRLVRGTRLPATRTLADDLGVSRGTVFNAYAQLTAEGWLSSRHGSGTYVAVDYTPPPVAATAPPGADLSWAHATNGAYDMSGGTIPDLSSFPRGRRSR